MTKKTEQKKLEKKSRPPIVVVMGHVDHGKTTILDWYRKTKIAEKESGGITQHIGAYEVEHNGKKITFIDTPGHEAFSKLRARGAAVADIAILVIAAEEGLKPQTKEALAIIQTAGIPFVVAMNKTDKPEANPDKVKGELAQENVLVESYGGKIPSVEVSAKSGKNMDELLETILLIAELDGLEADATARAEGFVLETNRDSRRGITATLLVRNGSLHSGDFLAIGTSVETAKIFENFLGKPIITAGPSAPIRLAGLNSLPSAGDTFLACHSKAEAEVLAEKNKSEIAEVEQKKLSREEESERPVFNLILKADAAGSLEALEETIAKLNSENVSIVIRKSDTGDIGESDVKFAQATGRVTIVGFRVKIDASAKSLAENANINILTGEIIYRLVDNIKKVLEDFLPPVIRRTDIGRARVIKLFKNDGHRQIIGGRVDDGAIRKGAHAEIEHMKVVEGHGPIIQLQHNKSAAEEVAKGKEFGAMIDSKIEIKEGDILRIYEEEVIKRTL